MRTALRLTRARPDRVWLAVFLMGFLLFALPLSAGAQPAAPDSLRPDTLIVPIPPEEVVGDTVPTEIREAAASEGIPMTLPPFPDPMAVGWATGRWEWTREELSKLPGLTALEFLQRIPGMARFRAGGFGRPESVTALGMGGGRMRIFIDGMEMDPFVSGNFELETLPLRDIERVRVERSLTELRVDVRTYRLDQAEAHSVVELGTGIYQTRLLRAIFSRGFGTRSTVTGSFDLVSTRGSGIGEPYSHSSSVVRWTYMPRDGLALQADWRRTAIDREGEVYPRQSTRSDLTVRARSQLSERLFVDAILGYTTQEDEVVEDLELRRSTQVAFRGGYAGDRATADVGARIRNKTDVYPLQPTLDVEGRASFAPAPVVRLEGSGRFATWGGASAVGSRITGTLTPVPFISIFGTMEAGSQPVPVIEPALDPEAPPVAALRSIPGVGTRGGVELVRGTAILGFAAFNTRVSTIAPFGQPFDDFLLPLEVEPSVGGEAYARIPIPILDGALSFEGWYTRIQNATDRPYTPADIGRVGLLFHDLYFGDQLEPTLRLEAIHRGSARVSAPEADPFEYLTVPYQSLDLTLQVRIIDVEAFLIWNNLLGNRLAVDLPGVPPASARILYGAEWRFRN